MKAIAIVAHPDDCVIYAYGYMHNHPEYQWTICYLTLDRGHYRGKEISEFWQKRNIPVEFLGFPDARPPKFINEDAAMAAIHQAIKDYDLVLTHANDGDYEHPHHLLVNKATANHPKRIRFAKPNAGNVRYTLPPGLFSLDELPSHKVSIRRVCQDLNYEYLE